MKLKLTKARLIIITFFFVFFIGVVFAEQFATHIFSVLASFKIFAANNPLIFFLTFLLLYISILSVGLPGGAIMALLSGYFFGLSAGFCTVMLGVTSSALSTWYLVKYAKLGSFKDPTVGPQLNFLARVSTSPFQSLLLLRLVPVLPFYLVNLFSAASGASLATYLISLCLGLIPSTLAFVTIGGELSSQTAAREVSLLHLLTHPLVIFPSLVLMLLAFSALFLKWFFNRE